MGYPIKPLCQLKLCLSLPTPWFSSPQIRGKIIGSDPSPWYPHSEWIYSSPLMDKSSNQAVSHRVDPKISGFVPNTLRWSNVPIENPPFLEDFSTWKAPLISPKFTLKKGIFPAMFQQNGWYLSAIPISLQLFVIRGASCTFGTMRYPTKRAAWLPRRSQLKFMNSLWQRRSDVFIVCPADGQLKHHWQS